MVDKIVKLDDNQYMIVFTNKDPVTVVSDNGCALHLVESLLSPRHDMGYSEYMSLVTHENEDTNPNYVMEVA